MIFKCEQYPSLLVHVPVKGSEDDLAVRFVDGVLDTDDKAVVAHLSALAKDGDGTIVAEKPARQPKPEPAPAPVEGDAPDED